MDLFTLRWLRNRFQNRSVALNAKDGSIFVHIPAGEFVMGGEQKNDYPKQRVSLNDYWIGVYAVTNALYLKFLQKTDYPVPDNQHYDQASFADHPVTNVSWEDAQAYAQWVECELPTEAQWEKAASGPQGLIYPWGPKWDPQKCHHEENAAATASTCVVYDYPEGVSGYGTYNQSGNVWEWCNYFHNSQRQPHDDRGSNELYRIIRGGGYWNGGAAYFRSASRSKRNIDYRGGNLGFRLVKNIY